jgi:hypothetical protein
MADNKIMWSLVYFNRNSVVVYTSEDEATIRAKAERIIRTEPGAYLSSITPAVVLAKRVVPQIQIEDLSFGGDGPPEEDLNVYLGEVDDGYLGY